MKQMLKRLKSEKGFTLVELLAVIVILGVILAIAIPAIGSVIDKAEDGTADNQDELILDAARLADVNTGDGEDGLDFSVGVTVQDLIDEGYLEAQDSLDTTKTVYKDTDNNFTFTNPSGG